MTNGIKNLRQEKAQCNDACKVRRMVVAERTSS